MEKRIFTLLLSTLFLLLSAPGFAQNPFANPSFEQFTPDATCDRPDGWTIEDGTTGFSQVGKLCVSSSDVTDGQHSLQVGWTGNGGPNNRASAWQMVDLSHVDTVAFDMIGPGSGKPQRADVYVYLDNVRIHDCGRVGNNKTKTCKVPVTQYAGIHKFEIRLEQRIDDNLGNVATDNVRPVNPCEGVTAAPIFVVNGATTPFVDLPQEYSVTTNPTSAWSHYRWFVDGKLLSIDGMLNHTFTSGGNHEVKLIAEHCLGMDTVTKQVQVQVPPAVPVSDFTFSSNLLTGADTVHFQDLSTNNASSWNWEITPGSNTLSGPNFMFIEGTSAESHEPVVVFFKPNTYTVCLTASNAQGAGNRECKYDIIKVESAIQTIGDTLKVENAQNVVWEQHGEHDSWVYLPEDTNRYRKIFMYYNLSCAPPNCNDWDYTTKVEVLHLTGRQDSNLVVAPSFRVNDTIASSLAFSMDTTYNYYYNPATKALDSVPNPPYRLQVFGEDSNPLQLTDLYLVYPANYYRYKYDTTGAVVDSTWMAADSTWAVQVDSLYEYFPQIEPIEIGRVSTPYAGAWNLDWSRTWAFDVTDYASILKNSAGIRTYFRGNNSTGNFRINIGFEYVEGIPPRDNIGVENIWKSDGRGQDYGNPENPITNVLKPRWVTIPSHAENSKLRVWINGHGFGANQNCAEFCPTEYMVYLDNSLTFEQLVWRDNCGMNPLYPQAGTWIYDRTNWCPGSKITPYDHELTSEMDPGETAKMMMVFDPYSWNGMGTRPRWVLDVQLLTFDEPNFALDAAVEEIIAPNTNWVHNRYNPICGSPVAVIKNTGETELTSVDIQYGPKGGNMKTYTWNGSLDFLETEEVALPADVDWASAPNTNEFVISVMNPNAGSDEYAENNTHTTTFARPPEYPGQLILMLRTNKAGDETSYTLTDAAGNVVASGDNLEDNKLYRDTFNLSPGCYRFTIDDAGEDGLSFWANNDGAGFARLIGPDNQELISFESDFGTQISQAFTVGYKLNTPETEAANHFEVFPNPAVHHLYLDLMLPQQKDVQVEVFSALGKKVQEQVLEGYHNQGHQLDIQHLKPGFYFVTITAGDEVMTRQFVKQ